MNKKHVRLLVLIASVISFFSIGVFFEPDFRILTIRVVQGLARYKMEYYGGKNFWIFPTDVAFILTLIPISFFIVSRKLISAAVRLKLRLLYTASIIGFYCLYCFLESELIRLTVKDPTYSNGALLYNSNNIHYKRILLATIISAFICGLCFKKWNKKNNL